MFEITEVLQGPTTEALPKVPKNLATPTERLHPLKCILKRVFASMCYILYHAVLQNIVVLTSNDGFNIF